MRNAGQSKQVASLGIEKTGIAGALYDIGDHTLPRSSAAAEAKYICV